MTGSVLKLGNLNSSLGSSPDPLSDVSKLLPLSGLQSPDASNEELAQKISALPQAQTPSNAMVQDLRDLTGC